MTMKLLMEVDAEQQVFACYNMQDGSGIYISPVLGCDLVECLVSTQACISPCHDVSNLLWMWTHLWFMSESGSLQCCRRGTLTRESDWLFVLSIIREYIQFTPFITSGPSDKWWAGLFNAGSLAVPFGVNEQQSIQEDERWEMHSQGSSIIISR